MSNTKRGWLVVAAALAIGASGIARADDGGDNGMNPRYGDSYASLQGQGRNAGTPQMAPQGAFAAHEMDGQTTTPMVDQMRQTQQRMAEQSRRNWDAMVEKTHAMTDKMRTSMNTQTSDGTTPAASGSGVRIAPVNPKSQAPTIVGPSKG